MDPFHPDIHKHIKDNWRNKPRCGIERKAEILRGGRLHLKLKSVQRAGFYYIKRVNDFQVTLSGWHPLKRDRKNTTLAPGKKFIIFETGTGTGKERTLYILRYKLIYYTTVNKDLLSIAHCYLQCTM